MRPDTAQAPDELPTRAALSADALHVMLRRIPAPELRDPFLQQTVDRLPGPDRIVSVPFDELERLPAPAPPCGLILHVARCGSTLVAQLLKQQPGVVVYAEPLPVNEILVPPQRASRARLVAALRFVGALLARHAGGAYVVKCSSWNTLHADLLTEAFPATPWILCVRDPVEVAVSLLRERPGWLRGPGKDDPFAGVVDPAHASRSPEEHVARLLAAYADAVARLDPALGRLVDYETLPDAVWDTVAPHFGLHPDAGARQRMASLSRLQSKAPPDAKQPFVEDGATKRAAASPALVRAVDEIARPAFVRLRRSGTAT